MPEFSIPSVLQDLEGEPYHLQPYPSEFDDSNRDEAFQELVEELGRQNRLLMSGVYPDDVLDEEDEENEDEEDQVLDPWLDIKRMQSLYTLVRKSPSLPTNTRKTLVETLCESIRLLIRILQKAGGTVSPSCRDAFCFHLYMLYSCMFLVESQVKADSLTNDSSQGAPKTDTVVAEQRILGIETLYSATIVMDECRNNLWQRGVVDEQVVLIPCKMAYLLLERSTGIVARRTHGAHFAMQVLTRTVYAHNNLLTHVVASLWDILHNHEHMAALTAELGTSDQGAYMLTHEMLREYGRLDGSGDPKMTGIKFVAPWITHVAERRPEWLLPHLSHLVSHLAQSEAYPLRSAVVTALSSILLQHDPPTNAPRQENGDNEENDEEEKEEGSGEPKTTSPSTSLSASTREQILHYLLRQTHDVSSYTRGAVLKAWIRLVVNRALPKGWIQRVTQLALERLSDKTVVVRKQAMQLLTSLLEHNPFGGNLDPHPYRVKLAELYSYVKDNLPQHIQEAQDAATEEKQHDEEALRQIEQATLATILSEITEEATEGANTAQVSDTYRNKVQALRFTQSALDFIDAVEEATNALEGMLLSANTSDVTEALRFFVQARHFSLPCAVTGMKRALALMWASEKAIRDEVLKAFVDVFVAKPGSEGKEFLSDKDIAKNLLVLAGKASVSELASIEEAISCLVREERIPADVFLILWSIASKGSAEARRAALQLIAMGAAADRSLVDSKSRLKLLMESCFGDFMQEHNDWALAAAGANVLQRVNRAKADRAKAQCQASGKQDADAAMEDELGMAAELEAENERQIADISENEILGRGLISVFGPLLVRVVGNEGGKFDSEILRQASTLALCKFMCVSSTFCEQHLPLLFKALGDAPDEDITMRANTVVALGDLAFRFPNEVEPYTPRIYACLRDPSTNVRRHTMMVLTHLILNDMVKVKGNVCEIALCLRDEDSRIRDTARLLFHELSKRSNNPVYNLLPDIVSQLSQRDNAREDFRPIMAFLLGFIKKEKQCDMLVEKMLQRFEKCTSVSQKADLAYCLTLLKVSEKSIKHLAECFKKYKDALYDDDVRKSFSSIVSKAKKNLKPEFRQFVEEWEAKLNEMAVAGAENEEVDAKAGKARARARKRATRKKGGKLRAIGEDNEPDCDDNSTDTPAKAKPTPRRTRKNAAPKPKVIAESSDEDEDMECQSDASVEKENTIVPPKSSRKANRRVIADSGDESFGD
eukprot:scaffold1522_cov166-Amphora_coffeaeformis.AAC.23